MSSAEGRVVLVTGAASGIGRAVAEAFASAGDRVVVADVNRAGADEVAAEIGGLAVTLDVTNPESVSAAVDEVAEKLGPIEVLVNNAGLVAGGGLLVDLPFEVFDTVVSVNFRGTFTVTKTVAAQMIKTGKGGCIVNISSIGARQPTPGMGHYEATKAAVDALTRTGAVELASHGIRVNGVAPGPVHTPMTAGLMENPQAREAWESRIPLRKIATTEDITPLVLFLASANAGHITGTVVQVDGGQLLV
ncbi:SDR family NAD(P)-dependent oxidoreductase [Streptosporangium saharense]|uniref:NAD(P)-dependent dehydrogenase (Short-subunit alcohol dehydrogenase family) n=1 Tax=Streptosporangium saharense TaxID=1706840 RepID=A0A7W7QW52_9ACTN|nr:SDR family NAD(P)-dependent oxidoreductase [Streptosporangium saharense]MBB4920810.1 NAD(P)-dependent dehydrogenase (short-subunit alcohol dehydrogenase family) [Streptosporangium saharense]